MMSLHEFGRRARCDYTTASRLMSGDRRPSTDLLNRICDAFELDHGEALRTLGEDQRDHPDDGKAPKFARYLRQHVLGETGNPEDQAVAV